MKLSNNLRSASFAIALAIVLVSTAYLAAGALHDRMVPEAEVATATIVQVDTEGIGGTLEHEHLTATVVNGADYDLGVKVVGLKEGKGVRTMFSLTRTGISNDNVDAYYYDTISHSWRLLSLVDQGNSLVGVLGPYNGQDVYEGFEQVYLLILFFYMDGPCAADCWLEVG